MDYEGARAKFLWNLTHPEPQASEVYTDDALLDFPPAEDRVPYAETSPPETTPGLPVEVVGGG